LQQKKAQSSLFAVSNKVTKELKNQNKGGGKGRKSNDKKEGSKGKKTKDSPVADEGNLIFILSLIRF